MTAHPLGRPGDTGRSRALPPLAAFVALALALTAYRAWIVVHLDLDPYVDEAYYWGWAQSLDWGYYSKPPLVAALIAAAERLAGDNLLALKLPSLVLYPATAVVIHLLGRRMFGEGPGFAAGLAFLGLPLVSALGLFVSTDAPLVFLWALGMLLLWRARTGGPLALWLAIGAVAGLGLLAKYAMAAFLGSAFLALALDPLARRQLGRPAPWLGALVALAVLAPNLWWNGLHGFPTFAHTAYITRPGERPWNPAALADFLGAQWLSFGLLLTLGLIAALLHVRSLVQDARYRFLLAFTLPLLAVVGLQALSGRVNGNWGAPVFVGATLLTVGFLAERGRRRMIAAAIALNLVLMLGAYHWPDLLHAAGTEMTRATDPYKRARGWRALAEAVAPHLAAHPDAVLVSDDREPLAQLIYALRPARHARWAPPDAPIRDHYALISPLEEGEAAPLLFVSARRHPDEVLARFASAERLEDVTVPVHRDFDRSLSVWLLRGFTGY